MRRRTHFTYGRERGAVLVVSLILLLVLSLIGVSSMQGTSIQERMSANLKDQYSAFNAAEAALRQGEAQAQVSYRNDAIDVGGILTGSHAASFAGQSVPTWRVEMLSTLEGSGSSIVVGIPPQGAAFLVTASSAGISGGSEVMLESIYIVED